MMATPDLRTEIMGRWSAMKVERSSWWGHWQDISTYLSPRTGMYQLTDRNRGERKNSSIYDSTGTRALKVLAAGMMSGMTSPARPWFRMGTMDPDLMKSQPVKLWMKDATDMMHTVFQRSNTYRALHMIYEELAAYGTAADLILPDFKNVIHHFPLANGQYCLGTDWKGQVNTLYREYQKRVIEVVEEFGLDNLSPSTRNLYDAGKYDAWVTIIHAIEPRRERDESKKDSKNMPWRSVHFEISGDPNKVLRESGFKRFPGVGPRWSARTGDIYGSGPGMDALGDIKQLQHEQLRKAQAIDFQSNPPLQVPKTMRGMDVDRLPGGISFYDAVNGSSGIKSAFEVNLDLSHLLADIADVRERINSTFYVDMFLMLSNANESRMTATEVAERHEEKLLMLGPVLERLQNELLEPLIDITFDRLMEANVLPPPPQELQGTEINVELISMLAQAQRAIGSNSIDRFVGGMINLAQIKPSVTDKFDEDNWADLYADSLGIDPHLIVATDVANQRRQARVAAAQKQQQIEQANQAADTANKLASAQATAQATPNASPTQQFTGYEPTGQFSGY